MNTHSSTAQALSRDELLRYSRQLMLPEFGPAAQLRFKQAKLLIVGLGGLGCPASLYLAAAGIGELLLADGDKVELSNLQRQIAYNTNDIGQAKATALAAQLNRLNPEIKTTAITQALNEKNTDAAVAQADLILDCSDNFANRQRLSAACRTAAKPLVSAAGIRLSGQFIVFRYDQQPKPCYHCLYPAEGDAIDNCATAGVLAPVVGMMGAMQALEALKIIAEDKATPCTDVEPPNKAATDSKPEATRLLQFDASQLSFRSLGLTADPECAVCGDSANSSQSIDLIE